jgi:hypothetical protein
VDHLECLRINEALARVSRMKDRKLSSATGGCRFDSGRAYENDNRTHQSDDSSKQGRSEFFTVGDSAKGGALVRLPQIRDSDPNPAIFVPA